MTRPLASICMVFAVGNTLHAAEPSAAAAREDAGRSSASAIELIAATAADPDAATLRSAGSVYGRESTSSSRGPRWLLDAMNRGTNAQPATFDDLIREVRERPDPADGSHHRDEREPGTPRNNPFAGFMSSWLTPKDYALLQVTTSNARGLTTHRDAASGVSKLQLHHARAGHENPYLVAQESREAKLDDSAHDTSQATRPAREQPPSPSLPAPVTAVAPNSPATQAPPRSSWQPDPRDDEKYFPQLNRF